MAGDVTNLGALLSSVAVSVQHRRAHLEGLVVLQSLAVQLRRAATPTAASAIPTGVAFTTAAPAAVDIVSAAVAVAAVANVAAAAAATAARTDDIHVLRAGRGDCQ